MSCGADNILAKPTIEIANHSLHTLLAIKPQLRPVRRNPQLLASIVLVASSAQPHSLLRRSSSSAHRRADGGRRRQQHGAGAFKPGRLRADVAADVEAGAEVGGGVCALLRYAAAGPHRGSTIRAPLHHAGRPPPPGNLDPRLMPRFSLRLPP